MANVKPEFSPHMGIEELIERLTTIAEGDLSLVQRALREAGKSNQAPLLEEVVEYIVKHRGLKASA